MELNRRQLEIIILLMKHEKHVFGSELAGRFSVTPRTIRYDIQQINKVLKEYDASVSADVSSGYYMNEQSLSRMIKGHGMRDIVSALDFNLPETQNERMVYLLFSMAFDNRYTQEDIEELFFVSPSVVYNDMKKMKEWLNRLTGIELKREKKYYFIDEKESVIRSVLCGIYTQRSNLMLQLKYSYLIAGDFEFQDMIEELCPKTYAFCVKENLHLSGESIYSFSADIVLTYLRVQAGFPMEKQEGKTGLEGVVRSFLKHTSDRYEILQEDDYVYLCRRLIGKDYLTDHDLLPPGREAENAAADFAAALKRFGLTVKDEKLLMQEIEKIIYIHKNRFYYTVDGRRVFLSANRLSHYAALILKYCIQKNVNGIELNEHDTARLAVCLRRNIVFRKYKAALVTDSNRFTADNLSAVINKNFDSEIDIAGIYNHYEFEQCSSVFDLVFTTVPLSSGKGQTLEIDRFDIPGMIRNIRSFLTEFQREEMQVYTGTPQGNGWEETAVLLVKELLEKKEAGILDREYLLKHPKENSLVSVKDGILYITFPLLAARHFKSYHLPLKKPDLYNGEEYREIVLLIFCGNLTDVQKYF